MSNESIPIGNVIHMGLTDGTKSDPISEVAEYFIQERENDLFKIDENYVICININENELLKNLLEETQEDFRRVIKNGIIKALAFYNYERDDTQNIDNAKNVWGKINIAIEISEDIKIHNINAEDHEGEILTFRCEIASVDERESITVRSQWHCNDCADNFNHDGADEPRTCPICEGKKIRFKKVLESESVQRILLRELIEDTENMTQHVFIGEIHNEYVGNLYMGERKKVTGVFKSIPLKKKIGQVEAHNLNIIDIFNVTAIDEVKPLLPTDELLNRLKNLASNEKLDGLIAESFAYHIYGHETEKLSIILAQIGGTKTETRRGSIHVLLIGDPSTSKSETVKQIPDITSRSMFTTGKGSTTAGLLIGMEKMADGRLIPMAGPVVLCNKGCVVIDEFDKMTDHDRASLHEAMEQQQVSITKAGKHITAPAITTIVACSNPTYSRWNPEENIMDNVPFPASLLARFDLKFRYLDIPNVDDDIKKTKHSLKMAHGRPDHLLKNDELLSFINYTKVLKPELTNGAEEKLIVFFSKLRALKQPNNSIPIEQRQFEGLIRIATAWAKFHFMKVVDESCVENAIRIYKESLNSFGMTVEQGQSQASLMHSYENRDEMFIAIFKELADEDGYVSEDELREKLIGNKKLFRSETVVDKTIDAMRQRGKIIEKNKRLKRVE
tara:strand:- start:2514 stop:4532 length:2019 start_codon:yes stop_codon:yes gene_type:complete